MALGILGADFKCVSCIGCRTERSSPVNFVLNFKFDSITFRLPYNLRANFDRTLFEPINKLVVRIWTYPLIKRHERSLLGAVWLEKGAVHLVFLLSNLGLREVGVVLSLVNLMRLLFQLLVVILFVL